MSKLIFDAGPLITTCKFSVAGQRVIDYLLESCEITVTESVRAEVVVAGSRYADAQVAQERLDRGQIGVLSPTTASDLEALLAPYGLGQGELDSILLTEHIELQDAILVIDDHLAYLVSDRLGRRKRFLLDVIADLAGAGALDKGVAVDIVRAIQTRYPPAFVAYLASATEVNDASCCYQAGATD
jgi:predicted nucleic acid-binding protein